jgi:2-polyprenyl-3-methyl-5-hydroxy-6-metoxy-1,4-benzoquinol methylase
MIVKTFHQLDAEALEFFAHKGEDGGPNVPQAGQANGVKVCRIMQITRDLGRQPFEKLRILDLGCGDGVYAIEAGLQGAEVIALDARTQRMAQGAACAKRHGLDKVRFAQEDVRRVTHETFGSFDVVYLLGLLYHLNAPDVFNVLENIYDLCSGLLVIDTYVSLKNESRIEWRAQTYEGQQCREHDDGDADELRRSRVLKSIDNTRSFRFTPESLLRLLHDVGFTSVYECSVPFECGKPNDRLTLAAVKGVPVLLSTYPWVNHKSETEIEQFLGSHNGGRI